LGPLSLTGVAKALSWIFLAIPFATILWLITVYWQSDDEIESPYENVLKWMTFLSMGFLSFAFVATLARDFFAALLKLTGHFEPILYGPVSFWIILAAVALLMIAGLLSAHFMLDVREVNVPIENLSPALDGVKIAQISDLHIGPTIRAPFVKRVVERVNALQPDVVVLTGDIVDGYVKDLIADIAVLNELKAPFGRFYITGNHEYYWAAEPVIQEFRRLGFSVPLNSHVLVRKDGAVLLIAGVPDYMAAQNTHSSHGAPDPKAALQTPLSSNPESASSDIPSARILLAHQPSFAKAASEAGYDLQLSGHTHGGQFFPWTLVVGLFHQFPKGLGKLGKMWIYVNRGTGYWGPPVRLGATAEISLIRLRAKR
jgi:predicted MPP superfamily phosphohydrolase